MRPVPLRTWTVGFQFVRSTYIVLASLIVAAAVSLLSVSRSTPGCVRLRPQMNTQGLAEVLSVCSWPKQTLCSAVHTVYRKRNSPSISVRKTSDVW